MRCGAQVVYVENLLRKALEIWSLSTDLQTNARKLVKTRAGTILTPGNQESILFCNIQP